jgi:hypothetical protein
MVNAIRIGEAGVLRVMSELILRGHAPFKPAVDDHGVDLMLGSGLRLQVKTATLRTRKSGTKHLKGGDVDNIHTGYYLSLGWCQRGRVQTPIRRKRAYSEECDYFIIWGIDENRFWIVPSFVLDNRTCLILGPKAKPNARQVADLAKQGVGLKEIADRLGCCEVTAWKRKRETKTPMGAFTSAVRNCEARWDFLNVKPMELLAGDRRREDEVAALELMLETK